MSSKSKYEYEKNKADVDLQLAIKSYEISKLKIKSSQANLKAATTAYEIIKTKYENGLVDNVSYLTSLSEKFSALSQLKTSQNDLEFYELHKAKFKAQGISVADWLDMTQKQKQQLIDKCIK